MENFRKEKEDLYYTYNPFVSEIGVFIYSMYDHKTTYSCVRDILVWWNLAIDRTEV